MESLRHHISTLAHQDEAQSLRHLLEATLPFVQRRTAIEDRARALVVKLRAEGSGSGVEAFLHQYGLNTEEGIAIMCLAEALLRIPDSATADRLIADTFEGKDWDEHLGRSDSLFVNASTWGLLLTGKVIDIGGNPDEPPANLLRRMVARLGEPVIRQSLRTAMKLIGDQFVIGETIEQATERGKKPEAKGYTLSYDMLGEGARTAAQAEQYYQSYLSAIRHLAQAAGGKPMWQAPSISVKLSALHPRYQFAHKQRVMDELLPRLKAIVLACMQAGISLSIDAEEAARLDLELELFEVLRRDPAFTGYEGIGFVLQAYQKRAFHVVAFLERLARETQTRLPVRLVKGAYWDSEIKWAQVQGLAGYPVFTRKHHTDVSYLACAARLLEAGDVIYPQFATHNALTVAAIAELAGSQPFEFQRLYGMGQMLYEQIVPGLPCRVYAPVGEHKDLLAYLIRRLLENGANTSFVNLLMDRDRSLDQILEDPIEKTQRELPEFTSPIPLPRDLYGKNRLNSRGVDWGNLAQVTAIQSDLAQQKPALAPVTDTDAPSIRSALESARAAFPAWNARPVSERAAILRRAADLMEEQQYELMALCIDEAKKTWGDSVAEIREAVDFCRYYAGEAERLMGAPVRLPGPTGESNALSLHGRGVFACISPWNFPLAIFTGQVAAALVTGNSVVAKPAEQTPHIARRAVALLHEAGVPKEVLQLVFGLGETVGASLVASDLISGVVFTGSTFAARSINRSLANRDGPIVPLIAETGGQNAMIVDSTALLEQATDDIVASAFTSAGQRCSALRVLFVQNDIAGPLLTMIEGAMDELRVGPARELATDLSAVIDVQAQQKLLAHIEAMKPKAKRFHQTPAGAALLKSDTFVPPTLIEIDHLGQLAEEVFGPVLHVIRYGADALEDVVEQINATGYGLTFGLQTRIHGTAEKLAAKIHAGNCYINRNMIGATVGVQPFGGEGLSGTGPKAGGPYYLLRFVAERTTTINTAAIGGNLELLA